MNIKNCLKKTGLALLNFFGITSLMSCLGINDYVCMYGVPGNFFTIQGTVTGDIDGDSEKEGIPGICITIKNKENDTKIIDDTQTDENGNFSFTFNCISSSQLDFELTFTDVDKELNGSFESKTESISFSKNEMNGKSDFGNENYSKNLGNIELNRK